MAQTRDIVWPAAPSQIDCRKYRRVVVFVVRKSAEWKTQVALLHAASACEKECPDVAFLCVSTDPQEDCDKLKRFPGRMQGWESVC